MNKFTSRAKALVHWMQENRRLSLDPLVGVKRGNAKKAKKTRSRRAMDEGRDQGTAGGGPAIGGAST